MNLQKALGLTADELCELQERADAEGWETDTATAKTGGIGMNNKADPEFKTSIVHARHGAFDFFWKDADGESRRNQFNSAMDAREYAREIGALAPDTVEQR